MGKKIFERNVPIEVVLECKDICEFAELVALKDVPPYEAAPLFPLWLKDHDIASFAHKIRSRLPYRFVDALQRWLGGIDEKGLNNIEAHYPDVGHFIIAMDGNRFSDSYLEAVFRLKSESQNLA